ncbi:GFA family protein [Aquirhabdus sp.]|uniref:GFA family protein n=1 Tax=Aquirhabdus sp. TaxID=2824160 RepID=UPI00396C47E9
MITGSCLCGGVKFKINAALEPIQVCHCSQCRKAQGGPFATNTPVLTSNFELTDGLDILTEYESSPGKKRFFCSRCGSPIYSARSSLPGVIRIRAGLLDEPLTVRPSVHAYVASKSSWWDIQDGLPKHPEGIVVP